MSNKHLIFVVLVETDGETATFAVSEDEKGAFGAAEEAARTAEPELWVNVIVETWTSEGAFLGSQVTFEREIDPEVEVVTSDDITLDDEEDVQ